MSIISQSSHADRNGLSQQPVISNQNPSGEFSETLLAQRSSQQVRHREWAQVPANSQQLQHIQDSYNISDDYMQVVSKLLYVKASSDNSEIRDVASTRVEIIELTHGNYNLAESTVDSYTNAMNLYASAGDLNGVNDMKSKLDSALNNLENTAIDVDNSINAANRFLNEYTDL
jgi:hypothetical protein